MNILQVKKYCFLIKKKKKKKKIEHAKFTISAFEKAFEKHQLQKQVDALESLESSAEQLPSIKDFT